MAGGYSTWHYIDVPENCNPKEYCKRLSEEQDGWSEHYRRVEYRKVKVPLEIIEENIRGCRYEIKALRERLKMLKSEKESYENKKQKA